MSSPLGGGATLLTHRPVKAVIEVYPGQDMEFFLEVPAGGDPWPAGTSAELRFYASAADDAAVLATVMLEVPATGEHIYGRMESADLANLPDRAVFAVYASLPTAPTTDYLIVTGVTKPGKRG
ncbi:hypothetical protein TPB0596_12580 [Tsukamurella pulmonis]|uniref:LtfC-like domain-containing protein n=1 Tax=Tsukamurella pulmonis TaxID=47312 RepID=UPI001EDD5CFE|nr:hypothetical protein [Tsukamurella pulmonis]BDD81495.1 hypothetical protein TPB0596_12580 [Tsukamurella pulmonis]